MPKRRSGYKGTVLMEMTCGVCNDKAIGYNFDAVSCESCKAFFRRNAIRTKELKMCSYDDKCRMSPNTRKFCQKCRLRKCFEIGMNPDLVQTGERLEKRANHRKAKKIVTIKKEIQQIQDQNEDEDPYPSPIPSLLPPSPIPSHYSPVPHGPPLQAYSFYSPPMSPYVMSQPPPYMVKRWSAPASVAEPTSMPEVEMVSIPKDMLLRLLQSHPKYSCRCSCSCGKYEPNTPIVSQINRVQEGREERTILQLD